VLAVDGQPLALAIRARGAAGVGALVVVEESPDIMNSLNLSFDNLEKKYKKEKAKVRERKRRGGR